MYLILVNNLRVGEKLITDIFRAPFPFGSVHVTRYDYNVIPSATSLGESSRSERRRTNAERMVR